MDGSAVVDALKGLAGGGGGQPGAPPGQAPAGAAGQPPGAAAPGGAPGGPPGGGGQPNPQELIQNGMLALFLGLSQMGLQETANDIVQRLQKRLERMQKSSPQGRQGAAMNQQMPGQTPPGVGPMPGMPGQG